MDDFKQFLNPGEQVIEVVRPHKGRFIIFGILGAIVTALILVGIGVFMFATNGSWTDEATGEITTFTFEPFIPMGIGAAVLLIGVISSLVVYNNTVYAYTDQRVLFRTGFIGKDFHFLEYKSIQGISVFVGIADKFFHPNTGNIIFMSSAMPMMMMANNGHNNGNNNGYTFKNVPDAYNLYQKINNAYNEKKAINQ